MMGRDSTPSLEASPQHPHEFTPSDIRRDCRAYRRLVERESHLRLADRQDPEAERQHAQQELDSIWRAQSRARGQIQDEARPYEVRGQKEVSVQYIKRPGGP